MKKTLQKKRRIGAAVFGIMFLALMATMYIAPHTFFALDTYATTLVHPYQTFATIEFFIAITTLGNATGIVAIAVVVAYYLRDKRADVLRLILLLAASSLSVEVIKMFIGRVRPPSLPWLGALHSYSFPSGHATLSMALFGFIAVIAYTKSHTAIERALAVIIPGVLILLIGASRIILAAHYFSDVIAGFLLGGFWLFLAFSISLTRLTKKWHL